MTPLQRSRYILVAGNIGSGKSALAAGIAGALELRLYEDPFEANPFLREPHGHSDAITIRSQLWFLIAHHAHHRELADLAAGGIKDGSLFDCGEVFAPFLKPLGLIEEYDWALYRGAYEALRSSCTLPTIVLWLRATPEVLRARIRRRGHTFESQLTCEFLEGLESAYKEWAIRWTHSPLIEIDTTNLSLEEVLASSLFVVEEALRKS